MTSSQFGKIFTHTYTVFQKLDREDFMIPNLCQFDSAAGFDKQTGGQTDRRTDRQTDRQTFLRWLKQSIRIASYSDVL